MRRRTTPVPDRSLAVAAGLAAAATFGLVVLGGAVRATGSGMGCPDWPLCKGQLGPAGGSAALWEQSHRYVVLLVTALVVVTAALVRRHRTRRPDLVGLLVVAVAALVLQAMLGAITVWEGNAPITVVLHLALGMLLLGVLVLATVRAAASTPTSPLARGPLTTAAAVATLSVLVSGSVVADTAAFDRCASWPLCSGSGWLVAVQLLHRAMVLALVVTLLLLAARAWSRPAHHADRPLAVALLVLLAAQVAAGALAALHADAWTVRDLHLALGTAVWTVVVVMGALPRTSGPETDLRVLMRVSGARSQV